MIARSCLALAMLVASVALVSAQDRAVQFDVGLQSDIRIVTEVVVDREGASEYRHPLAPGSRAANIRAFDRASGKPLPTRIDGRTLVVSFPRPLGPRAEQRLGIEEAAARAEYITSPDSSGALTFSQPLSGRVTILLPTGYTVRSASAGVQVDADGGRMKVGVIALDAPITFRLEAVATADPAAVAGPGASMPAGTFRAEDERSVVYWLESPETQSLRLALELRLTKPGQSHVYSVLRKDDNITNPEALDVDRGVVLPARLVSGKDANALGDAPSPMPDDASVFVADLGYGVPVGGSARVRVYQVATDKQAYLLSSDGELRWTRFLARLRTRIVLPSGWALTSVDQPAVIGHDNEGRVTLDFTEAGGPSPNVVLTARRSGGAPRSSAAERQIRD